MLTNIFNTVAIFISLSTATGIVMHDTRIDRAAATALSVPAMTAGNDGQAHVVSLSGDAHTHTERASLSQVVHDLKTPNPRMQPRSDDKKHALPKRVAKGHHPFDNYNLPLV